MTVEKLITDHIDIWSSALQTRSTAGRGSNGKIDLYGIKKLRELILELAVRGKLVPQDPNDEPASELLKQIAKERDELVKSKAIRKPKALEKIAIINTPFDLPDGWEWCYLNDIGDWGAGATPSRSNSKYYNGDIPWFKSGELSSDFISESEESVTELALQECSLRDNKVGDVLIAMYGATIGKTSILNVRGTTNQAVCACTPYSGISNIYLLTLLKAYKRVFIGMGAGGAQPNISREKLIATIFALPPKNEQKRIIHKVDELMSLCDQLEQQSLNRLDAHLQLVEILLATLTDSQNAEELAENWARISQHFDTLFTTEASIDALKQTILQLAVMGKLVPQNPHDEPASELLKRIEQEKAQLVKEGKIKKQKPLPPVSDEEKPFELPMGWEWCRIGDIIANMDAGWSPACSPEPSPKEDIWGVLKTTAVQSLEYREQENKTLPNTKLPRPEYEVHEGDILVTRAGPKNRVGVSCLVEKTRSKLMISDKIIRFHLISDDISAKYISLCLNRGVTADYLEASKSGMAESQMNISQENLRSAPVALPPTAIQLKVISTIEEFFKVCDQLKSRLQSAQQTQLHLADALTDAALN
ncbi:restriction endonuclease subunit S [Leclercia adecarboxylata]|uniref:restriction endonuclease subunit S n=1 Tax=Leclercia adecarboxylata TaxID=83655 RepID=UPI002B2CA664|nr:restriction endonuclease subunit S [Leclercia adecarboxylata]WNY88831.1 restriction endonuclease subunit S [Leclercia adecarboxylata]